MSIRIDTSTTLQRTRYGLLQGLSFLPRGTGAPRVATGFAWIWEELLLRAFFRWIHCATRHPPCQLSEMQYEDCALKSNVLAFYEQIKG